MSEHENFDLPVQNDSRGTDTEIAGIFAKPPEVLDSFDVMRFWSRIEVRKRNGCWPWRYGTDADGYGSFRYSNGATEDSHRVAYRMTFGAIVSTDVIRHSCDNPTCCNPWHLSKGTHADNVADRVARGRGAIGERAGRAKLTEKQVLAMRDSPLSDLYWARRYGMDRKSIADARSGKTWSHLD